MRLFLFGISAFSYWLAAPCGHRDGDRVNARIVTDCEPTPQSVKHLRRQFPYIPLPYHLSTTSRNKRRLPHAVGHFLTGKPKGKAFCRIDHGLYAPSPELCFVQLAQQLPFHELVRAGNVLCGRFRLNPDAGNRLESRAAITSKKRIGSFLRANPGLTGAKSARRALQWIVEGTASPPEAFLSMVFALPFRHGGFQLPSPAANQRIKPMQKARAIAQRKTLVPDLLFAHAKLAVEYDSTAEHTGADQLAKDARKRLALEAAGYQVITVTAQQIGRIGEMQRIARQAYKRMGLRFRPQSKLFGQQQASLFRMGWSLDGYIAGNRADEETANIRA